MLMVWRAVGNPWYSTTRTRLLTGTGRLLHASRFLFPASHSGFPARLCLSEHAARSLRLQVSGLSDRTSNSKPHVSSQAPSFKAYTHWHNTPVIHVHTSDPSLPVPE